MTSYDITEAKSLWEQSLSEPVCLQIALRNKAMELAFDHGRSSILDVAENPFSKSDYKELFEAWEKGKNCALPLNGILKTATDEELVVVTDIKAHKVKCFGKSGWFDASDISQI